MRDAVKRFLEKFKKDERGLTLVELLAVVVVLAIVGLIAFVAIGNVIENSKKDAHVANAQQVISAAELYEASGGKIEGTTNATGLDTLEDELIDPWESDNNTYNFTIKKNDESDEIKISSEHKNCKFTEQSKKDLASKGRDACK
ncbi:prepilin-type N-terminal cleavage/methylation domain-containing protein [Oceanobacillus indicireducens]|uniref:Prepilin-type N-terminal cleavage/methylation domain-containing protein n=1 Tax=Oceanobacillus indicireducens TaxID=1004261 RepID=A0A917XRW3_9BACI|nr:prepilin-type N-terminal cleavage/methylation domain-containing protein [Oceanobacillus indicireducens]GGN48867.1 hypothetical protein GCM10007971_00950 [Oceanobacillus indicireducens]